EVVYVDGSGYWGVENGNWCGIDASKVSTATNCWSQKLGYKCCAGCNVVDTDENGKWGIENNEWCGINC
ncbi:Non-catalytic module family DOC2, partial [Piromyces sp. E2]